tara:strand:- start:166 stop:504 length:339 start_codon:yes stop_codon:yes gene_type:complete
MNNIFNIDNSKHAFKSTLDITPRYADATKIQNYDKPKKINKKKIRVNEKKEYELVGHEIPGVHKTAPSLLNGKLKNNYTQAQIFEIDNTKPPKPKTVRFTYTNENKKLNKYG